MMNTKRLLCAVLLLGLLASVLCPAFSLAAE